MSNWGTSLRDPFTGEYLANIFFDGWLYFEYTQRVNDSGRCQGIFSPFHTPSMIGLFEQLDGKALDRILEVWFRPFPITNLDNSSLDFFLDEQYFARYNRIEHLNDGRPRDTFIGRSKMHLLERVRILPPQDPLIAPYFPQSPWRVPPHHFISNTNPQPMPLGAGTWPLPLAEGYDGTIPAPPPLLAGTSTAHRMCQMVQYAKDHLNLTALQDVTVVPPSGPAGLLDHPISVRYDNLLVTLQKMSAATWHGWFHGELAPGQLPVDFDLIPNGDKSWLFVTKPGGAGIDRSADAILGGGGDPVLLSVGNDNIVQPVILRDRTNEKSRIYVGGKNSGADRNVIAVVDRDRANLSPWNLIDHFIHSAKIPDFDYTGTFTDGILDAIERGTARLREEAPREEFTLLVRQNRTVAKGVNLGIGDIVTADLFGETQNYQIRSIRHLITRTGGVTLSIDLGYLDGRYFEGADEFRQIIQRQEQIKWDAENIGESE